jgi:hypothetical protein
MQSEGHNNMYTKGNVTYVAGSGQPWHAVQTNGKKGMTLWTRTCCCCCGGGGCFKQCSNRSNCMAAGPHGVNTQGA